MKMPSFAPSAKKVFYFSSIEEKHRAERFFECALSFRKAADYIAKGDMSDAVEIIKKLCI